MKRRQLVRVVAGVVAATLASFLFNCVRIGSVTYGLIEPLSLT